MQIHSKKAAVELSIGTMVVIVLAMSMLILGLVLVKNIFTSSIYNVKSINDKVKGEIGKLFNEEGKKTVVYLADSKAEVDQGGDWGVAFAIKNIEKGTTKSSIFNYRVTSGDISGDCKGLSKSEAENWIKARQTNTITLDPGEMSPNIIRFSIPETAPLCIVPYNIEVTKDGQQYANDFFDIVVVG